VIQQDCGLLCQAALSNPIAETMCTYACDAIGIYEFIKLIENEDLDPIYYCEVLDMCPIDDCTGDCMDIVRYVSTPNSAPAGMLLLFSSYFSESEFFFFPVIFFLPYYI
jgi:hypothetical protein